MVLDHHPQMTWVTHAMFPSHFWMLLYWVEFHSAGWGMRTAGETIQHTALWQSGLFPPMLLLTLPAPLPGRVRRGQFRDPGAIDEAVAVTSETGGTLK